MQADLREEIVSESFHKPSATVMFPTVDEGGRTLDERLCRVKE
jgi:hypothetical protein